MPLPGHIIYTVSCSMHWRHYFLIRIVFVIVQLAKMTFSANIFTYLAPAGCEAQLVPHDTYFLWRFSIKQKQALYALLSISLTGVV